MKTQKSIGFRFFITYLSLVLPFLAMSLLISTLSMRQMRQDAEAQLTARLNRVVAGLDDQYTAYYEGGTYLANLPELSVYAMRSSAISASHGQERLKTVYIFDRMIDELLLYYDESHLYGSKGLARASVYLRVDMGLSGEDYEKALSALSSPRQEAVCLRRGEGAGYVLLHYPMPSTMSVNFCMNFSTLSTFLQHLAGDERMMVSLTFPYGEPLLFGNADGAFRPLTADRAGDLLSQGKWIAATGKTQQMGTLVELRMDEKQLFANMNRMQYGNYALLIVGMLLSGLLSVSLTNRRLTQLRNLEAAVAGKENKSLKMGEFSGIHTLIQDTIQENIAAMGDYRALLRSQTARLLFHGLLKEEKEYAPLLSKCDIELAEENYFITGIFSPGADLSALLADRLYSIADVNGHAVSLYLDELPHMDENGQLRKNRGEKLSEHLRALGGRDTLLVMSMPVERMDMIDYAYLRTLDEITRKLQDRVTNGIFVMEESQALQEYELPSGEIEEFSQMLSECNGAKALKLLKKMLHEAARPELPSEIRQYLHYSIVRPLASALGKSENAEDARLLLALNQADPADEEGFSAAILEAAEGYCAHNAVPGEGGDILRYLQDNFMREDISLEEMADHFGVSREHMSRLFRAKTGMRYIDYITKLRMDAAWQMITTTDQSVSEIFRMVGYIDRSSSTKKFKKYFGLTPSEARSGSDEKE